MKNILLARRYAKALFMFALENKVVDEAGRDMALIANVMAENKQLRTLMVNPVIAPARKKEILRKVFESHIHKLTLTFLDILVRKGREREIQEIAIQFDILYLEYKQITRIELTTAVELNQDLHKLIVDNFRDKTQHTLEINQKTDANIIGGFVLKFDDYLFDASISKALSRMRKEFEKNLFKVGF